MSRWNRTAARVLYPDATWLDVKVAPYLSYWEIVCRCGCGFRDLTPMALEMWWSFRQRIGFPLTCNSACRCARHNYNVSGRWTGTHVWGMAIDIAWPTRERLDDAGITRVDVYRAADNLLMHGGLGAYAWGLHLDCRMHPMEGNYRWNDPKRPWDGKP